MTPLVTYRVLHLSRGNGVEDAFELGGDQGGILIGGGSEAIMDTEVKKSADWQTITVYKEMDSPLEPDKAD